MRTICAFCLLTTTAFVLLACAARDEPAGYNSPGLFKPPRSPGVPDPALVAADPLSPQPRTEEERWREHLLSIAGEFRDYTRLADDPHWAPTLCRGPLPDSAFKSEAVGSKVHGRKLYFLWVKDSKAYAQVTVARQFHMHESSSIVQPVGQALVKESYHPKAGAADGSRETGEPAGLFVMFKVDASTEGTDQGWVYGTLTADGSRVTSAGRIGSCIGCHEEAPFDRLFGPPGALHGTLK